VLELAPGWRTEVDRGPDWLFIRLVRPPDGASRLAPLAEHLWSTIAEHFVYRVVLELDQVGPLDSFLVGQLVLLHKRLHTQGGLLRLCGLSETNQQVLRTLRLEGRFPAYRDRGEAVRGFRPPQPR
jgi:anti-anti-sigma regulatory factor